jgi:hypothetical protein
VPAPSEPFPAGPPSEYDPLASGRQSAREAQRAHHFGGLLLARLGAALSIVVGAVLLRVIGGVGFANYDTLYALVWGQQLTRGETPQYGIPVAPTPHPLVEALGVPLALLGPHATEQITVALGFLALSACGWAVYRLGALWFNRPAGTLAALILLTRVPILSYGVRAYVDLPYLLLVLSALVLETRRPRAGAPVLALLALAGLLRPEAWVFSGLYWLYLLLPFVRARAREWSSKDDDPRPDQTRGPPRRDGRHRTEETPRSPRELAWLALLVLAAPLVWVASDWLVTGDALWSLTNTRHTAETLHRETGIGKVPEYIPRRIGEILGPAALGVAALGGVLSLLWLRARALAETGMRAESECLPASVETGMRAESECLPASVETGMRAESERHPASVGAAVGVTAVLVLAAFASAGLPIDTRYAFLAAAILCVFCGAAAFGWMALPRGDPHRRWWMGIGAVALLALAVSIPSQYRTDHHELDELARQQRIQNELTALVNNRAITAACEPIGVPNHAPIPLLALWLEIPPGEIPNLQVQTLARGTYVDPANEEVRTDYILDPNDPHRPVAVPAGFNATRATSSWLIFKRCQ